MTGNTPSAADVAREQARNKTTGQFGEQAKADPGAGVLDSPDRLDQVCATAGLPVMAEILRIVRDREQVNDAVFDRLTAVNVDSMYTDHIGPAIDQVEADLMCGQEHEHSRVSDDTVDAHVAKVCAQAGLGSMQDVLAIVLDRENVTGHTMKRVDAEHVSYLYEKYVGPHIDDLEAELLDGSCRGCGDPNDGGDGSDGWCGNCADARSCAECGEHIADDLEDIPASHLCSDCCGKE